MTSFGDRLSQATDPQSLDAERCSSVDMGIYHQDPQDQAPEALVPMETRIIDFLRWLLDGILVIVAAAASTATFKLSRKREITKPEGADYHNSPQVRSHRGMRKRARVLAKEIHQSTFGGSSDPLNQFAVVFCSIIHDADDPGVTNAQLVKECSEQNSVHICWELLQEDRFADL